MPDGRAAQIQLRTVLARRRAFRRAAALGAEMKRHEQEMTFRKKSRSKQYKACSDVAEMEGFEPPDGLTRQLISSQPRYDHFDTSPCFALPSASKNVFWKKRGPMRSVHQYLLKNGTAKALKKQGFPQRAAAFASTACPTLPCAFRFHLCEQTHNAILV